MELRRLRYFCAVADAAHLTRAAEGLGIRATSLSQQILALERELGADLFVRTHSGMRLTAAGAALLPQARTVLAAAERAREIVRDAAAHQITFHIGVTPGSPSWVAGRLWTAIRDRGATLAASDSQTGTQLEDLARGVLDAGVVVLPVEAPGYQVAVVSDVALGVVVGPRHRLARRARVEWSELATSELLWFPRSYAPGYHDDVLRSCAEAGWVPAAVRERPPRHGLFVAELAASADLVALRPSPAAEGLAWVPLAEPVPRIRHALVWSARHPCAELLAGIAADLADEAAAHDPEAAPRGQA
jgi:DNA-binding transcriptional LysR family regulator